MSDLSNKLKRVDVNIFTIIGVVSVLIREVSAASADGKITVAEVGTILGSVMEQLFGSNLTDLGIYLKIK